MIKVKGGKYPGKAKGVGNKLLEEGPTEAVFRVDLKTGQMRLTDEKGDVLPEDDDVTPEKIARYGIETENSKLLGVIFYAKCNAKHGGCVWKIVNGRRVLVW